MQKNAIFIFQKINFCNYTFHTRIEKVFWKSNLVFTLILMVHKYDWTPGDIRLEKISRFLE